MFWGAGFPFEFRAQFFKISKFPCHLYKLIWPATFDDRGKKVFQWPQTTKWFAAGRLLLYGSLINKRQRGIDTHTHTESECVCVCELLHYLRRTD